MKKFAVIVLFATIFTSTALAQPNKASAFPNVSAKAAILVEYQTGRVIGTKNADQRLPMASTTKIMTALLLAESGELNKEIIATKEMVQVEGSSMGLMEGDRVHYSDLLYGMMLASGNDAANATAISLAGSTKKFADMMNAKARQLGMNNTHFVTPSGLDDKEHYTTVRDMAVLAVYAMKNEDFAKAAGSKSAQLEYGNPPYKRTLSTHNRLLKAYEGACGIKTGFTKKSGRCLVSAAKCGTKGLIAVTLNAPNDWDDHRLMLDYGFEQLETRQLEAPGEIGKIDVAGGEGRAELMVEPPVVSLLPDDFSKITSKVKLEHFLYAPAIQGDTAGWVSYYLDGKEIATAKITVKKTVAAKEYINKNEKHDMTFWLEQFAGAR